MSRLRNRMTKATYWTDGELLRWPRDKRFFYKSLWSMAEDSCCIEDDPFEWKCTAWMSPMDADITVELLAQWRDELIEAGKLTRYSDGGKDYLYLPDMAEHEHPRNPQSPSIPLPSWVVWGYHEDGKKRESYLHIPDVASTEPVPSQYQSGTSPVPAAQPSPVLPSPVQSSPERDAQDARLGSLQGIAEDYFGNVIPSDYIKPLRTLANDFGDENAADRLRQAIKKSKPGNPFDWVIRDARAFAAKDVRRSRPRSTTCPVCNGTRRITDGDGIESDCTYCEGDHDGV